MSTKGEWGLPEGGGDIDPESASADDEAQASLAQKYQSLDRKSKEEKFLFVFVFLLFVDFMVFPSCESWGAPVALTVLQIIFLLILARKYEVREVGQLLDRVIESFGSRNGS